MEKAQRKLQRRQRAHLRVRGRIQGSSERPRLAVFKSSRYIYAQVIDDLKGETLVQANSREGQAQRQVRRRSHDQSRRPVLWVRSLAKRAKEKGIESVVFDRGGYQYHGRVKRSRGRRPLQRTEVLRARRRSCSGQKFR